MKFRPKYNVLYVICILGFLIHPSAASAFQKEGSIVIKNVNVLPMSVETVLTNRTVVIKDGRIAEINDTGSKQDADSKTVINGTGKYLIPGLSDMHVHVKTRDKSLLPLYVANGVTTVLSLNGWKTHFRIRKEIESEELVGPSLYFSGPLIAGMPPQNSREDGMAIAEKQKNDGYDIIKLHERDMSADFFHGVMEKAKELDIPVIGHIPHSVSVEGILKAGMHVAHMEEYFYTYFKSKPDYSKIGYISKETARSGIRLIPTLSTYANILRQVEDIDAHLGRPEVVYMLDYIKDSWQKENNQYLKNFSRDSIPYLQSSLAFQKALVKQLNKDGADLLAGTDAPIPAIVPGFSLHDELKTLVEAGLTPYEALKTATVNPAKFLNVTERSGTVEVGKSADLVLLNANPLSNIENTKRIEGVFLRGKWLDKKALQKLLDALKSN